MRTALTLTEKETFFIKENRQDPVTGDGFCLGDEIVFCASCKSAFLKESWEYMDSKHCGQTATLNRFPTTFKLKLSKPIVYKFKKAETKNRILAYLLDNGIAFVVAILAYVFFKSTSLYIYDTSFAAFMMANVYMLFRDGFGIKSSLGKRIMGLYFINTKTKENATTVSLFFKNLVYWGTNIAALLLISLIDSILGGDGIVSSLLGFVLFIANIIHLIVLLSNQDHFFDNMINVELVERNKN